MNIGITTSDDLSELRIQVIIPDSLGYTKETFTPELARLYADLLNRCADIVEKSIGVE